VPANGSTVNGSNAVTFKHCAAVMIKSDPITRGFATWGFSLGQVHDWGDKNRGSCIDCLACCVQGTSTGGGFYWPAEANLKPNEWVFQDCVAHNNVALGIYAWE